MSVSPRGGVGVVPPPVGAPSFVISAGPDVTGHLLSLLHPVPLFSGGSILMTRICASRPVPLSCTEPSP